MSYDKEAVVHENEFAALKDAREAKLQVFKVASNTSGGSKWVVAVSEHQAKLAMVEFLWPMVKLPKRYRDDQYTRLLEQQVAQVTEPKAS